MISPTRVFWLPVNTSIFERRHILAVAVLLALLLSLPMLTSGLFLDDYEQRIKLLTGDTSNIFETFTYGTPFTDALIQAGVLPWWTDPATKINFFRPLAEVFLKLDYALWPNNFVLMHLHSILWYALLVCVAGAAYRALMPATWAAGIAVVIFAIDPNHAGAVVWLCNRNVLISMICGLLSLLCHRREGAGWRMAAGGFFALGLTAGESALAISGYLLAYEVFLANGSWTRRFVRLLPYGLIGLGYLWYWRHAGFGTDGPGFYINPGKEPLLFWQEMLYRAPAYIASQFLPPPTEIFGVLESPGFRAQALIPTVLYLVTVITLLTWFLWPLLRRSSQARFYALGMCIAVIPISGVSPVGRALWYVGFGATGLLALYLHHYREAGSGIAAQRFTPAFVGIMLALHVWLSPVLYVVFAKATDILDRQWDTQTVHLPNASGANRRLLLISSNNYWVDVSFPLLKDRGLSLGSAPLRPRPAIVKTLALTQGSDPFRLERRNADTLYVRSLSAFDTLRPPPYRFKRGDIVQLDDVEIKVLSVSEQGAPIDLQYHFQPGTLQGYEVMEWQKGGFVAASLPEIGGGRDVNVK